MNRRAFLAGVGASVAVGVAGCIGTIGAIGGFGGRRFNFDRGDFIEFGGTVGVEPITTEIRLPVGLEFQDGHDRRYIANRNGLIYTHEAADLRDEPFLDLSDRVLTDGEQGLLGMALHPAYNDTRKVYVRYSSAPRRGTPSDYSHTFVLSEFRATEDFRTLIPSSERPILEIPEPDTRHNSGALAFGPDGYLYVGVGDGGLDKWDKGKGHAEDWYRWNRGGNGQDVTSNLLGSVLRIDVDRREGGKQYGVPESNPLVGKRGLDEHFAWGFRNPWGMSFHDGRLFVADVGQADFEEVNLVVSGGNYGWNVKEGRMCINGKFPLVPLPWCPDRTPRGERLTEPIIQYPHEVRTLRGRQKIGSAVVGGYVYEGERIPELRGDYLFGDLGWTTFGGRIFAASPPERDGETWPVQELKVTGSDSQRLDEVIFAFAKDSSGEVYVLSSGGVYMITDR